MGEWKEYKVNTLLSDGVLSIGDGYRAKNSELSNQGIPFARAGNINRGFDFSDADHFPIVDIDKAGDKISHDGDIVFTSKGTVGRFAYVKNDTERFVYSPQLSYWRSLDKKKIFPRFLFYWMHSREFFEQVEAVKGQTDMADYVSLSDQREMTLTLPSESMQRAIASVLSSLDDKIDLLHRQNKTLEALAETFFRQWFVDGAEEGWEEMTLGDMADHVKESIIPAKQPDAVFYHYSVPAYDDGREPKRELGNTILSNKYRVLSNSILISKLNPRIPRVWPVYGEVDEALSLCSTEFQVVKPKRQHFFGFINCLLRSPLVTQELANAVGGTSGSHQRVNPEIIFDLSFTTPSDDRIKSFGAITDNYWEKMNKNNIQIRALTYLRDTLLPKLMSGEVRVK